MRQELDILLLGSPQGGGGMLVARCRTEITIENKIFVCIVGSYPFPKRVYCSTYSFCVRLVYVPGSSEKRLTGKGGKLNTSQAEPVAANSWAVQ